MNGRQKVGLLASLPLLLLLLLLAMPRQAPLPDFRVYAAGEERKTKFFAYLKPIIERENAKITDHRQRLMRLPEADFSWRQRRWLRSMGGHYGLPIDDEPLSTLRLELLERIDRVPVSLAMAQAAKESGWGTSRFAREGNNLFGEWCFEKGCGITPENRAPGRTHEVRAFATPGDSVASYLLNLNSHNAYQELRALRRTLREQGSDVSGSVLAGGLSRYSERGEAYVQEVRQLIKGNELE